MSLSAGIVADGDPGDDCGFSFAYACDRERRFLAPRAPSAVRRGLVSAHNPTCLRRLRCLSLAHSGHRDVVIYAQDADRDSNTVQVFVQRLVLKRGPDLIETGKGPRVSHCARTMSAVLRLQESRRM